MIKIKDYIFNGNEIKMFVDGERIKVVFKNDTHIYIDATYEDIEWNYGTPQETQRQMQKELCKSCYYRDTISNKLKELEEENEKLKDGLNIEFKPRLIDVEDTPKVPIVTLRGTPNSIRKNLGLSILEDKKIEKIDISNFPKRNNSLKKTALKINEIIDKINGEE